jgi:hypothetical protein
MTDVTEDRDQRPATLASILSGAWRLDFACLPARPRAGCGEFCGDLAPHGRCLRHGTPSLSCVRAGERADDVSSSWLPRQDSNLEPAG